MPTAAQKRIDMDDVDAAAGEAAKSHKQLQSDVAENGTRGGGGGLAAGGESDRSPVSSRGLGKECVIVNLSEIRKEVQCSICLGIIQKTRTVMECLHRFCRECIDKSMRLGNKECPVCRVHCASRRSLRDDPNFDALIAALYPDIDKYEEEELAFVEEEISRNKQIQASIHNTVCQQAEACSRKRQRKATASAKKIQNCDVQLRGKKNAAEIQGSDDNKDNTGNGVEPSLLNDEHTSEIRAKRLRRWRRTQSASDSDNDNDLEVNRESATAAFAVLTGPSDRLAWGKNGVRSNTRHGSANTSNGKSARKGCLSKLMDHLKNLEERDNELDLHIMLVPIDEKRAPRLKCPFLRCRRTLSVGHLRQHVALQTALQSEEVEMYLVKELNSKPKASICAGSIDPCNTHLQALGEQDTLARLGTYNITRGHLLLAYQKRLINLKT